MKTSCFFTYRGPGRISIARFAPRGTPSGFRIYKPLAPAKHMLKMAYEPYKPLYLHILNQLDPHQVWDDLHRLAGEWDPVLLCWEKPPLHRRNFCHRRMVAEWFKEKLDVEVPELERLSGTAPDRPGGT